jgi:hypothetical protein
MTDRITIATRERPLSSDINNIEAMGARTLADILRYALNAKRTDESIEAVRNVVAGGLVVTPAGSDVSISPGVLLLDSNSLAPTPGTYDSTYRVGIQRTAVTLTTASPGSETFYLIEARPTDVALATVSRDILDPGTGQFVPTLIPKVTETRVTFQIIAGGANAPAPSGGDWVPIAILRRPSGGGAVLTTDIYDIRPLPRPALPGQTVRLKRQIQTVAGANTLSLSCEFTGFHGERVFRSFSPIDPTAARYLSPGTVLPAGGRAYLYLAGWAGSGYQLTPRQSAGAGFSMGGILVLSTVPPTREGTNSAPVGLPAPFGVVAAPAGTAYYVGTLIRVLANTHWVHMVATEHDVNVSVGDVGPMGLSLAPIPAFSAVPLSQVPATAHTAKLALQMTGALGAGVPNAIGFSLRPTGGSVNFATAWVNTDDVDYRTLEVVTDGSGSIDFVCAGAPGLIATLNILQIGWTE